MDRIGLPYRKNCEGYFFCDGRVLAQDTGRGYVLFTGGGIDEGESSEDAVMRETFEETGAVIKNLKKVGVIRFDWDEDWAKTEKQKKRYEIFRGEEMHLFVGDIEEFKDAPGDDEESSWDGEVLAVVEDVIEWINSIKPFSENMVEYYTIQLDKMKEMVK